MFSPIKSVDVEFFENEVFLGLKFERQWNFNKLKFDGEDYIVHISDDEFHIRRFWIKTLITDLKYKKIIFKDISYGNHSVNFWFDF